MPPTIGVLNCHPGILPDYRGCSCVEWSLYNGHPVGNTARLITKKIDKGPIIYIKELNIEELSSYEDIRVANYLDSIDVVIKAIKTLDTEEIDLDIYPRDGNYYKQIDDEKLRAVIEKCSLENSCHN